MTSHLSLIAALYVAAVADTALVPLLSIQQVAPCFLVLVGLWWMVTAAASPWRIVEAAAIGLVFDLNSGSHTGVGMAAFALLGFAMMHARPTIRQLGPLEQALVCAPLVAVLLLSIALANRAFGQPMPLLSLLLLRTAGCALYTAAISLPGWMILDWRRDSRRTGRFAAWVR